MQTGQLHVCALSFVVYVSSQSLRNVLGAVLAIQSVIPSFFPQLRSGALGRWARGLVTTMAVAVALPAQADRVDAGSFSVLSKGERIGREQFSLRRAPAPDGTAFELRSEAAFGERRVAVQLSTDSLGTPVHYSLVIREGVAVTARAGGQRVRGRFATQVLKPGGESAREYLLAPGTLVLEADFYHQLVMVLRGRMQDGKGPEVGRPVELTAIAPLQLVQQKFKLVLESRDDPVTIAGVRRPALRWRLEDSNSLVRTIWGDSEGRLLRVLIPARSIEVVRDDIPK